MKLLLLGTSLAAIAFAATSALGAAVSAVAFRALEPRLETFEPAQRASALLTLRLLPAALAMVFTLGLFVPAYLLLEPRDAVEDVSFALALLSAACAGLVLRGPVIAARDWRRTKALVRVWLGQDEPLRLGGIPAPVHLVETTFPLVTLFGIRRPRLLVARSVRDACTSEELSAILAHERAHLASRDNVKRLLFRGAPDPLSGTTLGARFEDAWGEAVEEAADERTPPALALPLASALVKVSRLALEAKLVPAFGSALYRSGTIDRRVRRLMGAREVRSLRRSRVWPLLAGAAAAATTLGVPFFELLAHIHGATEAFVALLP